MENNTMMLRFLLTICLILSKVTAFADEPTETDFIRIKQNEYFVSGEGRSVDKNSSYASAMQNLLLVINEERVYGGLDELRVPDVQPHVIEMLRSGSDGYHTLLYVSYDLAMELSSSQTDMASQGHVQPANPPAPPANPPTPPVPPTTQSQNYTPANNYNEMPDEVMEALRIQNSWIELQGIMSEFKKQGKISTTGATRSFSEVPDDAYMILLDDIAEVIAILSPRQSTNRKDYRKNRPDNESNHLNCKTIVWYK